MFNIQTVRRQPTDFQKTVNRVCQIHCISFIAPVIHSALESG
jgi:hypothetical protein